MDENSIVSSSGGCNYKTFNLNEIKELKFIMYFKEMSHVAYSLSMLLHLGNYLRLCGKNARVIIFSRDNDFMAAYGDMQLLNSRIVKADSNIIDHTDPTIPFIASDTSEDVIKAILRSDCDILIIFDRLLWKRDLIEGRTVFKYGMAGGLKQLRYLEDSFGKKFNGNMTIIEDESDDYIYIPYIHEFNDTKNKIVGTAQYVSTVIHQKGKKYNLLDYILEQCGIHNISE